MNFVTIFVNVTLDTLRDNDGNNCEGIQVFYNNTYNHVDVVGGEWYVGSTQQRDIISISLSHYLYLSLILKLIKHRIISRCFCSHF